MRRRRRSKSTWFPVLPTFYDEGSSLGVTWFETDLAFPANATAGDTQIIAYPLTLDETQNVDNFQEGASLRDYVEGQDYLLQRVVGKVWGKLGSYGSEENPSVREGILCIALAVLPNAPGTQSPDLDPAEYNPLLARNAQQPWIWRRTWRLDDPNIWISSSAYTLFNGPTGWPSLTQQYTGMQEGGHLDAKVRRRITREHRLYIIAAMGCLQPDSGSDPDPARWTFGYDLRVLGTMRRGKNKSSF